MRTMRTYIENRLEETERAREARLRSLAARRGLGLLKTRRQAYDCGTYLIRDLKTNCVVFHKHPSDFGLDLDDVEKYLNSSKAVRKAIKRVLTLQAKAVQLGFDNV